MKTVSKQEAIDQLRKDFASASTVIFADYKGVTSEEMNLLRRTMREKQIVVKVAKNNLVRVALKGTNKEKVVEKLAGPTLTCFTLGDAAELAKGLMEFSKKVEAFSIKEGIMGDQALSEAELKQLATLPSKKQLIGQLLSVFIAAQGNFARVLQAIADKKAEQQQV